MFIKYIFPIEWHPSCSKKEANMSADYDIVTAQQLIEIDQRPQQETFQKGEKINNGSYPPRTL
jgi:hypothetical protein